jgi:SAM-dependent methyltransferase
VLTPEVLRRQAREYYENRLSAHGATPAGVDWNSHESQELRFAQLAHLWRHESDASLLDYGCGYGALAAYVRGRGHRGPYLGFDVSDSMVDAARTHLANLPDCRATSRRAELQAGDYAVASGVFNVKQDATAEAWMTYVWDTIADLAALGTRGFAFNALSSYSDVEKRRPDLFYADSLVLFDRCKREFSRFVTLLHDYPLYEFTLIVRR